MANKYYIVGVKHCGKTSVGLNLANKLNLNFRDLDHIIESNINMGVRDYYKTNGKDAFQNQEYIALEQISNKQSGFICATGGGICDNSLAFKKLKELGNVIFINTDCKTVYKRIIRNGIPAFLKSDNPEQEFNELYIRRSNLYKELASMEIDGNNKTPEEVTRDILKVIKEK